MTSLPQHSAHARRRSFARHGCAALVLVVGSGAWAADLDVASASELSAAMTRARPGDRILLAEGVWRDQYLRFEGSGRQGAPIVLTARRPGATILTGSSRLDISGQWLQVSGLVFKDGALPDGQHVVRFLGSKGAASNSSFSNSAIIRYNPPQTTTRYAWVAIYGTDNRVDNNLFEGQTHSGPTVVVQHKPGIADRHVIERNHFKDRPPSRANGFEAIRIGSSVGSDSDSQTIVRQNLFENIDAELEIVSVKAGGNQIVGNTFLRSKGTITLRQGNNNQVLGNVFIGEGVADTGGIRVMGENHVIAGNQFDGIAGRLGGAIVLHCGETRHTPTSNPWVRNVRVANNKFNGVGGAAVRLDAGCEKDPNALLPDTVDLVDNEMAGSTREFVTGRPGNGVRWERNAGASAGGAPPAPVQARGEPLMSPGSIVDQAVGAATGNPRFAADARAAARALQQRDDRPGRPAPGEARSARAAPASVPVPAAVRLSRRDVGPTWSRN